MAPSLSEVKEHTGCCYWPYDLLLGSAGRSMELDLVIFMGPLQLEKFYDFMIILYCVMYTLYVFSLLTSTVLVHISKE